MLIPYPGISLLQRETKFSLIIPLGRGNVYARGLGGIPISPLKSPRAPHNPLQTAGRCPEPAGLPPRPAKHGAIRGIFF